MTTATVPQARAARRLRLIALIRQATEELAALERAEHRTTALAARVPVPAPVPDVPPSQAPAHIIRAWATSVGIPTRPRGDVSHDLREAYAKAHP